MHAVNPLWWKTLLVPRGEVHFFEVLPYFIIYLHVLSTQEPQAVVVRLLASDFSFFVCRGRI